MIVPNIRTEIDTKIQHAKHRLSLQGLEVITSVEQELSTSIVRPIDFHAMKAAMEADAIARLKKATEEKALQEAENAAPIKDFTKIRIIAAERILHALPLATTAEHLLNIEVYDRMIGKLEFRGSPDAHEEGYYDAPGTIEIRLSPSSPLITLKRYDELVTTIFSAAEKFGLKAKLLNEQMNMSVWDADGNNLTSARNPEHKTASGRILMGMLDTCEDVWPLRPHRSPRLKLRPDYGFPIYAGPNAKGHDSIRVVNYGDVDLHHYEQLGDYTGGVVHSIPYRMLMMLDGVARGINNPTYDQHIVPVKILAMGATISESDEAALKNTFKFLNDFFSCELDKNGCISNIDYIFQRPLGGSGHTLGEAITKEMTGHQTAKEQERVKAFFQSIRFVEGENMLIPDETRFCDLKQRLSVIKNHNISIYDSIRFTGSLVPDEATEKKRIQALRKRWGDEIVDAIAAPPRILTQPKPEKPKSWRDYIRLPKPKAWAIE